MFSDKPPDPGGRYLEVLDEAEERKECSPEQPLRGFHPLPADPKEPPGLLQGSCLH